MASSKQFQTGFLILDKEEEQIFLSVTPGFEHGPGIQRDGITSPRMTDPRSVPAVRNHLRFQKILTTEQFPPTANPYEQRAGTWTLYHHLKEFIEKKGNEWQVVGIQSNGDLTMNYWHVAYIGNSHIEKQNEMLCGLLIQEAPQEPFVSRIYHSLVKWNDDAVKVRQVRYECLDLRIQQSGKGYALKISDPNIAEDYNKIFNGCPGYNPDIKDISGLVEFTLSGKPIVERGVEISLVNAIDKFEDVRHIFNLPVVKVTGLFQGLEVKEINLGEYLLFKSQNDRRAAIYCPVIIDLDIENSITVSWNDVAETLPKRHFRKVDESPSRRGEFRHYLDKTPPNKVEIFFPHNVYPFGVIGIQSLPENHRHSNYIVCLSSGGLSGQVGNTLEGISRIMYDFLGCTEAMVLDEGYDVFFISNPYQKSEEKYKYSNDELLGKVLAFTKRRVDQDQEMEMDLVRRGKLAPTAGMGKNPLNEHLGEIERDYEELSKKDDYDYSDYSDVVLVEPQRSQMRSVLIFAAKKIDEEESRQMFYSNS